MYTTYEYYITDYCCGGDIVVDSASAFNKYMLQVQSTIDMYTFDRCKKLEDIPNEVKNCCCDLVELIAKFKQKEEQSNGVTSERNNNYSVSYESSEASRSNFEKEQTSIINKWLANTGLLYRGL